MPAFLPPWGRLLLVLVLTGTAGNALALDLDDAVELALQRDYGLRALDAAAGAAEQRAVADGALPDPELILGADGVPVDDPLGSDMMTMYKLGLRQRIPAGDTRRLARERGRVQSHMLDARGQARRLEITRDVRLAWLDWAVAGQATGIARDALETFDELMELTEARYRTGTGRQRDVDQARLEQALLQRRVLDAETAADAAAARLARWTGQPPGRQQAPALPVWPEPPGHQQLLNQLIAHPELEAESRRIHAGQLDTDLARQDYRPTWMIEGGYAHQRGRDPMTMNRQSDKLFAMVSFNLPLFTAGRQDRRVAAARAEVDALEHERDLRLQEWAGELETQRVALERGRQRLGLFRDGILPEAGHTVTSTLTAYRTDRASFDELVRARLALLDQQLDHLEARRLVLQARIRLAWLGAEELP